VLYTVAEFWLLFLAFLLDKRTVFFPLLGLIIVIRSCLIFQQQISRMAVTGMVFVMYLLVLFQQVHEPRRPRPSPPPLAESFSNTILTLKLNTAVIFGLTLLFTLLLVNALLSERESRKKLTLANAQLRQYALRIENQATLQERNRIAREIHDALGHALTAQSIQLENALLFLPPDAEKTASFLQEAKQLGARALQEVRRSVSTLRSDPLRGESLEGAIAKAVQEFHQMSGILPTYTLDPVQALPSDIRTAVYRIVQESLTNIYKHSAATQVNIRLQVKADAIHLQIDDNGEGFEPERNTTGFGLQGMRERTIALGGQFELTSKPGNGCHIRVLIPLPTVAL
jgi:signal transduction histidine kinase